MVIDLSKVEFVNDMFSAMLPDGGYIVLNKIDESLLEENSIEPCEIKAINIELLDYDQNVIACPRVIGLGNDKMSIKTDYTEYEGEVLTPDNMAYCTIEIYE